MSEKTDRIYEKKELLLASAKSEFLKHGYERASLRQICKNAGLTTGALYFFFKNKADLFDQLVRDVAIELQEMMDAKLERDISVFRERKKIGVDERIIRYLIEHRTEVILLCGQSDGTKYEGYRISVENRLAERFVRMTKEVWDYDLDLTLAKIIAKMRVESYAVIVLMKDLSCEEAIRYANQVYRYSVNGFDGMIRELEGRL